MLNKRKLTELPHALINGKLGYEVVSVFTDLLFVEAICSAGLLRDLIADYIQAIDKCIHTHRNANKKYH